ncbi:Aste57867_10334 [Aphanomyces stellatus]|uniref:Aste57867_10334 protein n=1 Tax=Aphanomyces stellatus TaxID=120398 RepID=A0A485KQ27_9STRA|nr:hypothetical protein As57867_010294 [Aphanomyces stellatus]VFT87208.1 Aste57867_10334 [Aphanomyces stellatus]
MGCCVRTSRHVGRRAPFGMACKDCLVKGCHLCRRCITAHCTCGEEKISMCLESKACDCFTLHRCARCRGCKGGKIVHCNCDQHARGDCLCASIQAPDDDAHEVSMKKRKVMRRFSLPSRDNIYGASSAKNVLESRALYLAVRKKDRTFPKFMDKEGTRGVCRDSYLGSLERDPTTAMNKQAERANAPLYFDRAIDNAARATAIAAQMPSSDLVDYLVYTGSLKTTNVPELLGTMESTAAVAAAIVVEEVVRQQVAAFLACGQACEVDDADDLTAHIHELLNGAEPAPGDVLGGAVAGELKRVFGDERMRALDVDGLVTDAIATIYEEEDEATRTLGAWKKRRIAAGIRELSEGAVHSEDGIYVTLVQGKPSYWFSAAMPESAITSEGYSSYQEAWSTKWELEARIEAFEAARRQSHELPDVVKVENGGKDDEDAPSYVETKDSAIKARHHVEGMPVPTPVYFPNDRRMQDILKRIALPLPETEDMLIVRERNRRVRKLKKAREDAEVQRRMMKQGTESYEQWLRRCDMEERCPNCSGDVGHMENDECLLWKYFQAKMDKEESQRTQSFLDCSIEWFGEKRDVQNE